MRCISDQGPTYIELVGHRFKVDRGGRDSLHIRHVAMCKARGRERTHT